ncbi:MAG TPA: plasmid pRiA4b ORF-3 family protein [Candidatus Kapabacteria bacterium]|nr:plasmid pRiA4b ORF-3 family protein [Candidatus Kapabacteria bacterium]
MSDRPSREELRRLIHAAVAYRDAAPWEGADSEDMLVIENPETGQVGFLEPSAGVESVHPGARIALDAETFELLNTMIDRPRVSAANLLMQCNLVTLLLEPADECDPDGLAMYAEARIDVPGDRVPLIFRDVPRRLPPDLDAAAARFATLALEQAVQGLTRYNPRTDTIAVRVLRDGVWRDEARGAEDVFGVERPDPPAPRAEWSGLAACFPKRESVWELGAMFLPGPVDADDDELLCAHLVADAGGPFLESIGRRRDPEGLCALLVEAIELRRALPKVLLVSDPAVDLELMNLTMSAGIQTEIVPTLTVIDARYEALIRSVLEAHGIGIAAEPPSAGIRTIEMPTGFRHRALVVDFDRTLSKWYDELPGDDADRIQSVARLALSQPRKGVKQLRALVEEFPEHIELRSELAHACLKAGWPVKAIEVVVDAIREMPASLSLTILHAQVLVSVKGPEAALEVLGGEELYDIVDEGTPVGIDDVVGFHLIRAIAAIQRGDYFGARRHFAVVQKLRPDDPMVNAALARIDEMFDEDYDDDGDPVEMPEPERIIRMRIELDNIEPAIWRRFDVASNWTFETLHVVIQEVMGWEDAHLHEFRVGNTKIVMEFDDEPSDGEIEYEVRLDTHIKRAGMTLSYDYDFGDNWSHTIVVEAIAAPEPGVQYPRVLSGERACPPEDCGGFPGYWRLLAALADPSNDEHEEILGWLGDGFDPEAFDLEEINAELAEMAAS